MSSTAAPSTRAIADVWYRTTSLPVTSGHGCTVVTADGLEYLDVTAGSGALSTGHCHPRVVAAIREQAGRFIHAQVNAYLHDLLEPVARRIVDVTPASVERVFLANSGSEAVEGAIKLARHVTGRNDVIVFRHGFHGRTALAMAMSTLKVLYREGSGALPSGVHVAPYPYWQRTGEDPVACGERCLAELRTLLATEVAPTATAAIVVETILGEGGFLVPPPGFLQGLRRLCDETGILLVLDEVQAGFGRTGRWFACEHFSVDPDVLVMAKGLASGFPISAIGAGAQLMSHWPQGSHGGTYGGNPLGCAAALATIDVIEEEGLLENAAARGAQLRDGLHALQSRHPLIADVRGVGLMQAVELVDADGTPSAAATRAVLRHCLENNRVILLPCGTDGNAIRFLAPLVVTADEVDRILDALGAALVAGV